jgi:hypothetical protein
MQRLNSYRGNRPNRPVSTFSGRFSWSGKVIKAWLVSREGPAIRKKLATQNFLASWAASLRGETILSPSTCLVCKAKENSSKIAPYRKNRKW